MTAFQLFPGKCEEKLKDFPDNHFDSCVCDPPYEIGFMGKKWDGKGIAYSVQMWSEVLRILKPGGYLLAFGSTRTSHRMVCAIEDAGFEIRDTIMWVYGSGFPKSLDVSKAIDGHKGIDRQIVGEKKLWGNNAGDGHGGFSKNQFEGANGNVRYEPITVPSSDEAKQYSGWGTALKPAYEPIVVARKPLEGTVAENVLKYGTGGININGCRVDTESRPLMVTHDLRDDVNYQGNALAGRKDGTLKSSKAVGETDIGRWPANLIHDGSEEVVSKFPVNETPSGLASGPTRGKMGTQGRFGPANGDMGESAFYGDIGSASRFFYVPKTSRADRNEGCEHLSKKTMIWSASSTPEKYDRTQPAHNNHPTVKPTQLMQYLCRLVTPKGGLILDHFCGSGSTGKAAMIENFNFIGIDEDPHNIEIAHCRIQFILNNLDLFGVYIRP